MGKKCERLSGQYCTYLYRRASTRVYVFFLLVFHLSLSNPGVVRASYVSRNFRAVSGVVGKRLVGERCALIMTVESARVEARQSSVATSDSPVVCHCARLLRFSFEQILDGNATTRSGLYSFRFRLMRAHTCYCRVCYNECAFMGTDR